jgi:S-adenosylmethionine:tRNA ribosyltransferase-isomerase
VRPASSPRARASDARLLVIDPLEARLSDARAADLDRLLDPGDLLVVNDAATVPGSLAGRTSGGGAVEARLSGPPEGDAWVAVLFGAGDWRERTEDRLPPPRVGEGERIVFEAPGASLAARVVSVSPLSPRLVTLRFEPRGAALWDALYRVGRPVQYAYLRAPLALWDVQTPYASRPWAAEPPSTGLGLDTRLLMSLRARGIGIARITEAAGLSSTGDPAIDAALPFPERFEIPEETVLAIARTRARGGSVIAAGTTVLRALEGAAVRGGGALTAGAGITDLRVGAGFRPRIVDGLLTGIHEPGTSHHELMRAFVADALLDAAIAHAESAGYLGHEFGDLCLVLPARAAAGCRAGAHSRWDRGGRPEGVSGSR